MAAARIIYARSHTLPGLLIRHFDGAGRRHWSHAGIVVGSDHEETMVIEARFLGGVQRTTLRSFIERYSRTQTVVYEVPDLEAGYRWLAAQAGKPYDWTAVLGHLARRDWSDEERWHCQELAEGFLAACGLRRWRPAPHLITPNAGFSNLGGAAG